jgi:hypothetical protein
MTEEGDIQEIVEYGKTFKDILSDLVKEFVTILIVASVVYLAVHNNTVDILKTAFDVVIGFYIGSRSLSKK